MLEIVHDSFSMIVYESRHSEIKYIYIAFQYCIIQSLRFKRVIFYVQFLNEPLPKLGHFIIFRYFYFMQTKTLERYEKSKKRSGSN
jgi:hypothetical protein